MKKILWIVVAILLLATFSDHPVLLPYKQKLYAKFSDTTHSASEVKNEQALQKLANLLQEFGSTLGKGQQAELKKVSSSKAAVLEFQQSYCVEQQFHPLFYGDTIRKVCTIVQDQSNGL
ncbi:MAG: hypothetical protein KJ930_00805 [Gammaproteobacteria bacterium]|jgi:uncharacterized protein YaaR (DUF327 family)|nr:hypothetical protein [Gammaproteobacteria bacterium]MBU2177949.1 hypothetical protein [Gammaproteobacteria bacterium]MBU2224022.1 hypothetical protein [Gammaproteobacteria bacterium]MBU2280080.1 hypothetical protein [Gammaproteobacteria bacterium]MBU2428437.1 hypothetical protein [Gammaproteobacteria bacterium]